MRKKARLADTKPDQQKQEDVQSHDKSSMTIGNQMVDKINKPSKKI
jgi:hypothetical protein